MSALERLPEWATTGVGSLPHTDVEEACALARPRRPVLPPAAALTDIRRVARVHPGRCAVPPPHERPPPSPLLPRWIIRHHRT